MLEKILRVALLSGSVRLGFGCEDKIVNNYYVSPSSEKDIKIEENIPHDIPKLDVNKDTSFDHSDSVYSQEKTEVVDSYSFPNVYPDTKVIKETKTYDTIQFPEAKGYLDIEGEDQEVNISVDACKNVFFKDEDGDGYGSSNIQIESCEKPVGYVDKDGDCADKNPLTYPDAPELCDGLDNNCDGKKEKDIEQIIACGEDGFGEQTQICIWGEWENIGPCIGSNVCPVLNPLGNIDLVEGQGLCFSINAFDAEDLLVYSLDSLPSGANLKNKVFCWSPTCEQAGKYDITFSVSDGTCATSETMTITVKDNLECTNNYWSDGADLKNYPSMFVINGAFNGIFVVGDNANACDTLAMIDISNNMWYNKASSINPDDQNGGESIPVSIPITASKLASEVADIYAQNMIVSGNPCNNAVAAQLTGNQPNCLDGFTEGIGKIKMFENGDYLALLVAGPTCCETRAAAKMLANYKTIPLYGKEMEVKVVDEECTAYKVVTSDY